MDQAWIEIKSGSETCSFVVGSIPDTIQAEMIRTGAFYESGELDFLRNLLPASGSRILDVGANIGNHAIYFARVCRASYVAVIEPAPDIVAELRQNIERNLCDCVDLQFVGIAAGAKDGLVSPVMLANDRAMNNRGGTRMAADPLGSVQVRRLDELITGSFDLIKIDVEGMALDVLEGASGVIAASDRKPILFVEVEAAQVPALHDWRETSGYRVRATFEMYAGLINYVLIG